MYWTGYITMFILLSITNLVVCAYFINKGKVSFSDNNETGLIISDCFLMMVNFDSKENESWFEKLTQLFFGFLIYFILSTLIILVFCFLSWFLFLCLVFLGIVYYFKRK